MRKRRHPAVPTLLRLLTMTALCALLYGTANARSKEDLVIMKNGDRLTCEVKNLESGVLYVSLDYVSGNVGLDWKQVEKVQSKGFYQITLRNGDHFEGSIERSPNPESAGKEVVITTAGRSLEVPASSVVQVETKKESFWRQLQGSVSSGVSYTSGNSQTALNTNASVSYPATTWQAGAAYTSSFSGGNGISETNLQELQAAYLHYLSRNSFVLGLSDFLHSTQQELQLRTTLGGGYGRYWIRTSQNDLKWFVGPVYIHEQFQSTSAQPSDQNVEAVIGAIYKLYRFDRYTLQSQGLLYPGLSDYGRVRATTTTSLNVKLPNNFSVVFSFWDNYDSRPPVATAKKNELGVSTNVGYTF
jgi:putative salt-induced outer membrane protein YdiY